MSRHNNRFLALCAAATAALVVAGTAQAVDLRDWGRKFPTSERFVVLSQFSNQAVLDKETQLVWQRTPYPNQAGGRYSATQGCSVVDIGGRRGWRLPSFHEMASLADPAVPQGSLALPAGHPFTAVPNGRYWTATRTIDPTYSYIVDLSARGYVVYQQLGSAAYFWCVRGGGPISEY